MTLTVRLLNSNSELALASPPEIVRIRFAWTECVECGDVLPPILLMSALFTFTVFALGFYIWLINKYPSSLKRWVSTSSILINHVQTIAIVGNLRLDWPQSVIAVTGALSFNVLNVSIIRPECLLINTSASPFFIFTIASCGFVIFVLAVLFLMIFVAKLAARCVDEARANAWVDSGEFARSVVFSLQLTTTWSMIASLIATIDADEVFGPIGAVCGASPIPPDDLIHAVGTGECRRHR